MPHNLSSRRLVNAERMNLQIRMAVRQFTRLSHAHSKKIQNLRKLLHLRQFQRRSLDHIRARRVKSGLFLQRGSPHKREANVCRQGCLPISVFYGFVLFEMGENFVAPSVWLRSVMS